MYRHALCRTQAIEGITPGPRGNATRERDRVFSEARRRRTQYPTPAINLCAQPPDRTDLIWRSVMFATEVAAPK